jgi:DNA repair protein RadC
MRIKDLPSEARPRERLLSNGADSLSDTELIAILLRTGVRGSSSVRLAEMLRPH